MASLRRSKTLSPDGQTARFLYTIIKQLDLKTIDWNEVAGSLDITNGHAARMRFSRFKQHIEGSPTQPRGPRAKKDGEKAAKGKGKGVKRALEDDKFKDEQVNGKLESVESEESMASIKPNPGGIVKQEPGAIVKQEQEVKIKKEPGLRDRRDEDGQPPVVRIKREPEIRAVAVGLQSIPEIALSDTMNSSVDQLTIAPATFAAKVQSAPLAPPPQATVSLADLQLPPASKLPKRTAASFGPNHTFQSNSNQIYVHGNLATPGIKMEPNPDQRMVCYQPRVVIKNEPVES